MFWFTVMPWTKTYSASRSSSRLTKQRLHISLAQKNQTLGDLYEAACRVYADELLPSRLALAAHALRELTDALPKAVDVPIPVDPAQITDQVKIELFWMGSLKSDCHQKGEWIGNIDEVVRTLLKELHRFFEWLSSESSQAQRSGAANVSEDGPNGWGPLPEDLGEVAPPKLEEPGWLFQ